LNDARSLSSLERESDIPLSLSPDLAPHTSSHKDITNNVLVFADPPTTLNDSFKFGEGEDFESARE